MSYNKIDPAFKERWVKALRSGEYQQTQGVLTTLSEFCCLGVACDLLDPDGWTVDDDDVEFHFIIEGYVFDYETIGTSYMPVTARHLIGLGEGEQSALAALNDGRDERGKPRPFSVIADWIEENL